MLRYKTKTRTGLVALYDIRPGNGAGPFLQPRSPHGAHFGWKLPIQGQIFGVLRVNRGQISIFSFYNPKVAHPCAISRRLSHCASKSVQGSLLYVGPREKSHTKSYISPLSPEVPRERIFTTFGNRRSSRGHNQSWQIVCQSVQGFRFYRGSKFPFFP